MEKLRECLSYDDVLLVPAHSNILSRSEISISSEMDEYIKLDMPIIASPMDTVCEWKMAATMSRLGGLGIIHRYNTISEQTALVGRTVRTLSISGERICVGAAIGATGDAIERAHELVDAGVEVLCIDIAHGHHSLMKEVLYRIKKNLGAAVHVMAGNIATRNAYEELSEWGADSIRVGIGGGSICSTRIQTGHGVPTLTSILDCVGSNCDTPIIADGGIKNSGDMVKALAAGADFIMIGSLLAGTNQTPGAVSSVDGNKYKIYRGMASKEAQTNWKGTAGFSEGISTMVPYKGDAGYVLKELREGVLSGFSYSGAKNMEELWFKSKFIRQTAAGQFESSTHITKK